MKKERNNRKNLEKKQILTGKKKKQGEEGEESN